MFKCYCYLVLLAFFNSVAIANSYSDNGFTNDTIKYFGILKYEPNILHTHLLLNDSFIRHRAFCVSKKGEETYYTYLDTSIISEVWDIGDNRYAFGPEGVYCMPYNQILPDYFDAFPQRSYLNNIVTTASAGTLLAQKDRLYILYSVADSLESGSINFSYFINVYDIDKNTKISSTELPGGRTLLLDNKNIYVPLYDQYVMIPLASNGNIQSKVEVKDFPGKNLVGVFDERLLYTQKDKYMRQLYCDNELILDGVREIYNHNNKLLWVINYYNELFTIDQKCKVKEVCKLPDDIGQDFRMGVYTDDTLWIHKMFDEQKPINVFLIDKNGKIDNKKIAIKFSNAFKRKFKLTIE